VPLGAAWCRLRKAGRSGAYPENGQKSPYFRLFQAISAYFGIFSMGGEGESKNAEFRMKNWGKGKDVDLRLPICDLGGGMSLGARAGPSGRAPSECGIRSADCGLRTLTRSVRGGVRSGDQLEGDKGKNGKVDGGGGFARLAPHGTRFASGRTLETIS
jgi:hypothetical protein